MNPRGQLFQELQGGYSVESGVFKALYPDIPVRLTRLGRYESRVFETLAADDDLARLGRVSAISNSEMHENVLASRLFGGVSKVQHDPIIGYFSGLYAGHVLSGDYRMEGSSGGFATWLLVQLLRSGEIDGVIHAKKMPPDDSVLFRYAISSTEEEIRAGSKSKYYPLEAGEVLANAKLAGGRYAVTGIPSFIREFRLLVEEDASFANCIRFAVGLICGHQKSTRYADAIAWEQGISPGNLIDIDFRKKIPGARADEYVTEIRGIVDESEVVITKTASEVFVSSWSHGFFKSKFSDYSDDAFNETADVAIGDAWLPQYASDYRGTNLVIVRNPVVQRLVDEGIANGALRMDAIDPVSVVRSQPGLVRHARDELPYRLFRADARGVWRPKLRTQPDPDLPSLRRTIQDVREQIAAESHIHFERAVQLGDWSHFVDKMKPLVDRHNSLYALANARQVLRGGPVAVFRRGLREVRRRFGRKPD